MSHREGQVGSVVTRRNGGTTRHRKGPQNLPNLTTVMQKPARLRVYTYVVSVHVCVLLHCDT